MIVYIMRGLPGSGKSTLAKALVRQHGVIHCPDDFFVREGRYEYDPARVREAHDWNFRNFEQSLLSGMNTVVADAVHCIRAHFFRYLQAAEKQGYRVAIVSLPHPPIDVCVERNVHGVNREAIEEMLRKWEP